MISRRYSQLIQVLGFFLALGLAGSVRAQYGTLANAGYPTFNLYGRGYGSTPVGGYGAFPNGYATGNGQIGSGYQGAGQLYNFANQTARPQTTTNFQPLFSAITALPGWNAPVHSAVRHRFHAQPSAPRTPPFDDNGKIVWPSTIADDPATADLRRAAEAAVRSVVHESNTTGHASIRPVIDAKNKLSAFEKKALPAARAKNSTDGASLEVFFFDIDRALDALTYKF